MFLQHVKDSTWLDDNTGDLMLRLHRSFNLNANKLMLVTKLVCKWIYIKVHLTFPKSFFWDQSFRCGTGPVENDSIFPILFINWNK